MCLTEFDQETYERNMKEEYLEEGRAEGILRTMCSLEKDGLPDLSAAAERLKHDGGQVPPRRVLVQFKTSLMKRLVTAALSLVLLLSLASCCRGTIGTIRGAEWDSLVIGGVEYLRVTDSGVGHSDRDRYLGRVSDGGNTVFRCWSVRNDGERRYIYCLREWEGFVYERASAP